jgi:hypothetical protein
MNLLAVDPALNTGWAFGPKTGTPHAGVWRLPGFDEQHSAQSFGSAYAAVRCVVAANKIEGVIIEPPMIGISKKNKRGIITPTSHHGDRMLTMLSGAIQAGAINGGAKWVKLPPPNTWRAAVLGNGYPKDPKAAALEYCRLMKWCIEDHNAAEAACMLVWGHGQALLM